MTEDIVFLKIAVKQAELSVKRGGFPAGAVIVKNEKVISKGVSLGYKLCDPIEHAEASSIRKACKKLKSSHIDGATLYASLQPCLMCFSVANWAGISRIVFGCKKTDEMAAKNYYEGINNINDINKKNNRHIKIVFIPDFEQHMLNLIKDWEKNTNEK